jgi:hypothetical protein
MFGNIRTPTSQGEKEGVVSEQARRFKGSDVTLSGDPVRRPLTKRALVEVNHKDLKDVDEILHEGQFPHPRREWVLHDKEHAIANASPNKPKSN